MALGIADPQANAPAATEGSAPQNQNPAVNEENSALSEDETLQPHEDTDDTSGSEPGGRQGRGAQQPRSARLEVSRETIEDLKAQRKRRQEAEREAAYWRGVAESEARRGREGGGQQGETPTEPKPLKAPRMEDFATLVEYQAARDEYITLVAEHRAFQRFQAEQERVHQSSYRAREAERTERFHERIAAASTIDPEIDDIVRDPTLTISPAMGSVIKESELAPQLLRYLHENRKEAKELSQLSPEMAAYRLARLESKIEAKEKAAPNPPVRRVSSAPEPIPTVNTGRGGGAIDEERIPIDEWIAKRNAKLRERGRG